MTRFAECLCLLKLSGHIVLALRFVLLNKDIVIGFIRLGRDVCVV